MPDRPLRIVAAVHDPPVWTLPAHEVRRIADALPDDEIVDAREPAERQREYPNADVLLATRLTPDEGRLFQRLKWIHSSAVGVAGLLVPAIVDSDIVVTNARGVHSEFIAEHAMALALAIRRSLHVAGVRQQQRNWSQKEIEAVPCPPVSRSRMLVVGVGEIGKRVGRFAAGLGFTVVGIRRRVDRQPPPGFTEVLGPDALASELALADVVVLCTPRTTDTRAMLGTHEFAVMKPNAVLVNVARGRLIDEAALVHALERGQIAGAGLDAFEREPLPPEHPLWALPNVLISPHVAAFGEDYWRPAIDLFLENVRRFKRNEPLVNVVDKHSGY